MLYKGVSITNILGDLQTDIKQIHLYDTEKGLLHKCFDTGFSAAQGLPGASK